MSIWPFRPSVQDVDRVSRDVAPILDIQAALRANDAAHLKTNDRVAHQYQIAGGRVVLRVAPDPPENVRGVGLFVPGSEHTGVGRISTGQGCPHSEALPDFLGLRLAFQTEAGRRVDFLAINDPSAPTATHVEFVKLLEAGAAG